MFKYIINNLYSSVEKITLPVHLQVKSLNYFRLRTHKLTHSTLYSPPPLTENPYAPHNIKETTNFENIRAIIGARIIAYTLC